MVCIKIPLMKEKKTEIAIAFSYLEKKPSSYQKRKY